MQKKIFLQRGQKGGGGRSPYVKYLLWAALCLMLLVIITPYLLDRGKQVPRRPIPSEKSAIKKELPKPPEPAPAKSAEGLPGGLAAKPDQTPEPVKPPETQPPQVQPAPAPTPAPAIPEPQQPKPAVPAEPQQAGPAEQPRDLFPKSGPSAEAPSAAAGPSAVSKAHEPSVPSAAAPAAGLKPAATEEKKAVKTAAHAKALKKFAVQVGCFREKQNAEDIRRTLKGQGYDVVICPSKGPNGYIYTVVTKPIATMSKAATLAEQIKSYNKISPIVVNAPVACKPGEKQPAAPVSASKEFAK